MSSQNPDPIRLFDANAVLIYLPTLHTLDSFWKANKGQFKYAAGCMTDCTFLPACHWFFGESKHVVVRAALRWNELGTHVVVRADRDEWDIASAIAGMTKELLATRYAQPIDLSRSYKEIEGDVLSMIFDNWDEEMESPLELFDHSAMTEYVAYWHQEKVAGLDYYGTENEHRLIAKIGEPEGDTAQFGLHQTSTIKFGSNAEFSGVPIAV